jgi:sec-independent protein translocase protein TatB
MFGMSAWHLAVLVVVGLFVFGPERLPTMIRDLGKALRQVRATAQTMQDDLKSELGPEVGDLDLRSLHPRTFVEKHLFGDEEDPLGLDFLRKDAEPLISFDKPTETAQPTAEPAYEPPVYEPEPAPAFDPAPSYSPAFNKVKFDVDAT